MKLKKRCMQLLAAVLVLISLSVKAFALTPDLGIVSDTYVVMDAKTGQILLEKNKDKQKAPASITKILTLALALEKGNLDDVITVSKDAVYSIEPGSTHIALVPGEVITFRDAVMGTQLISANDAANVVAEYAGGSMDAFVAMMNNNCLLYTSLFDDLLRHTRFSGGLFNGITDYSFELNDDGKPYWVVTTYSNKIGFGLPEATGVLLVDASTGRIERYTVETVPEWVDRVQPEQFIIQQINNRGEYVRGIFNFANKDKYKASRGQAIIYNDGNCYLMTCVTSVGSDESSIGFMLVDMVSKESFLYEMAGATEYSAQRSAEGKVQHLGYKASSPIIINISGQPTYFMTRCV